MGIALDLKKRLKSSTAKELCKFLGINTNTLQARYKIDSIPRRHRTGIVEFFEGLHDDNMQLCDDLLKKVK